MSGILYFTPVLFLKKTGRPLYIQYPIFSQVTIIKILGRKLKKSIFFLHLNNSNIS